MTKAVFRACNGCRLRKVRCSGSQPCAQCAHLNLPCISSPAPAKRQRVARGRLVAQLRGKAGGKTPDSATPSNDSETLTTTTSVSKDSDHHHSHDFVAIVPSVGHAREIFVRLLSEFEQFVYPSNPIIRPDEIRTSIANMHVDSEAAALVYAFAAITTKVTRGLGALHEAVDAQAQVTGFIHHGLKAHREAELRYMDGGVFGEPEKDIKRIMTCIFLEMSMMTSRHYDRSFIILREGIAMLQALDVHRNPRQDTARFQRLYWEAYIHERYVSVVTGYPCALGPLATRPLMSDPNLPPHIEVGFNRLIRLFLILDDQFLDYWIAQRNPSQAVVPGIPAEWIESKQAQLDEDEVDAGEDERNLIAGGHGPLTEAQHVDLFVTRLWLRTLVWQLALSHGLLRSNPSHDEHEGLSLHFPAQRLSAQLHHLVSRMRSVSSIAMHGSGILQKLFEITSTIADVLALPAGHDRTREGFRPHMENFVFVAQFLRNFESILEEQKNYLQEKLDALQQLYVDVDFSELA